MDRSAQHANPTTFLKTYTADFSLDRLKIGVDNIRCDVLISRSFQRIAKNTVLQIVTHHIHQGAGDDPSAQIPVDADRFRQGCVEIFQSGLRQTRIHDAPQIDSLVQIALLKLLREEVHRQLDASAQQLEGMVRKFEVSGKTEECLKLKGMVSWIGENRGALLCRVWDDVAAHVTAARNGDVVELRRSLIGRTPGVPADVLSNPMICCEDPRDDTFTLKSYQLLFGHRPDDPENYAVLHDRLISLICALCASPDADDDDGGPASPLKFGVRTDAADAFLKREQNVDLLFNCFQTRFWYEKARKRKSDADLLKQLKTREANQKKRLKRLIQMARKTGLLEKIVANYEIQSMYESCCPPLSPQLISQYLLSRRARAVVARRLEQLKNGLSGKAPVADILRQKLREYRRVSRQERRGYLLRFLKDFIRYHRDLENHAALQEAMARIHLVTDDRLIHLARANETLYEFRLADEKDSETYSITGHVVLKADVRNSTGITLEMVSRGLNPATHFSLNFFNPINQILPEYGAEKLFVEGDAIIIALFEYGGAQSHQYSVARACGLAAEMIGIVGKCNEKNRQADLPPIEIGIGITFRNGKPAFLFDGDQRIMISSAINLADRLSACSKTVRNHMNGHKKNFNLYVFQSASLGDGRDDLMLRYNVNGIELSPAGFQKLRREIDLKVVKADSRGLKQSAVTVYIGRYPLTDGRYRNLVIREGLVPSVDPQTFKVMGVSRKIYYEVCTHPGFLRYVDSRLSETTDGSGIRPLN